MKKVFNIIALGIIMLTCLNVSHAANTVATVSEAYGEAFIGPISGSVTSVIDTECVKTGCFVFTIEGTINTNQIWHGTIASLSSLVSTLNNPTTPTMITTVINAFVWVAIPGLPGDLNGPILQGQPTRAAVLALTFSGPYTPGNPGSGQAQSVNFTITDYETQKVLVTTSGVVQMGAITLY